MMWSRGVRVVGSRTIGRSFPSRAALGRCVGGSPLAARTVSTVLGGRSSMVVVSRSQQQHHHRRPHRVAAVSVRGLSSYPPHTVFDMPALSPTMESGSIAKWNVGVGDSFSAGESLCEVQTDKATVDFEAQDDGVVAKILVEDPSREVNVGVPICVVVEEESDVAAFADFVAGDGGAEEATSAVSTPVSTSAAPEHSLGEYVLMPSARHASQSRGLDATVLYPGTGKDGRITKGDVLRAIANGVAMPAIGETVVAEPAAAVVETVETPAIAESAPVLAAATTATIPAATTSLPPPLSPDPSNPFEDVPNNKMRKIIASRLTESKATVPHSYVRRSIPLDKVLALRKSIFKSLDVKFSVNDAVVRASALALRDVPEVNASFDPKTGDVVTSSTIDVSVAVATPTGLVTPIVTNADERGLSDVSAVVRDLASRAQSGRLAPEEYQGGTFTISNLGMFGIGAFSAVINPPQCAILAVGGGVPTIVPDPDNEGGVATRTMLEATLSADRRVVDEATASLFLQALGHYLSEPESLLL